MRWFSVLLAALALGSGPASAAAARPFALGVGNQPGVAVGAFGAAHVVWKRELGGADVLDYCRVPAGARACDVRHTLSLGDRTTTGDAIAVVPSAGTVHLLVAGGGGQRAALFTSRDDGATFAGPIDLGELPGIRQAVMAPGGGFTLLTDGPGVGVARYEVDGSGPAAPTVDLGGGSQRAIARLRNTPVVTFVDSATGRLRTRSCICLNLNDPARWLRGPGIAHVNAVAAAGGPYGMWVAYTRDHEVRVRRLRYDGWVRDQLLNRGDDPQSVQLAEGPGGVVASWATTDRVRYRSSIDGHRWSRTKTLFRGHEPAELRLAMGRTGGWMVWDGDELNGGSDTIRIAPVPSPRY